MHLITTQVFDALTAWLPSPLPFPFLPPCLRRLLTHHTFPFTQSHHPTLPLISFLVFIQIMGLLVTWVGLHRCQNHLQLNPTLPYNLTRPVQLHYQPFPRLNQYSHRNSFHKPTRPHHTNSHRNRLHDQISHPNSQPNPSIHHSRNSRLNSLTNN